MVKGPQRGTFPVKIFKARSKPVLSIITVNVHVFLFSIGYRLFIISVDRWRAIRYGASAIINEANCLNQYGAEFKACLSLMIIYHRELNGRRSKFDQTK